MFKTVLLFLLLQSLGFAMQIKDDPAFQKLYSKKADSQKITLMIYTATVCPQCAYMKERVFTEPKVAAFLKKHFLILKKDIQKDELPDGFEYFGVPTIFFVDKNGSQHSRFVGSARAKPFLEELQKVYTQRVQK